MKKKFPLYVLILFVLDILFSIPCHGNLICTGPATTYFQYPSLWVLVLIPLSLLAITLKDQKHKFWLKFTGIFFVISMVFVFIMPETARGLMLNPDRESINWFLVGLYSFISIIYFIVQFFKKDEIEPKEENSYFFK